MPTSAMQYAPDGKDFTWGPVHGHHTIGPYHIIEFEDRRPWNAKADWSPSLLYHVYVYPTIGHGDKWYDTCHTYHSLDHALMAAIVFRSEWDRHGLNEALNERLSGYIMRALRG